MRQSKASLAFLTSVMGWALVTVTSSAAGQALPRPGIPMHRQELQGWEASQIERAIFLTDGTAAAAQTRLELQLRGNLELINEACPITPEQKQKLLLAGRGDIKRLFDRYEEIKQSAPVIQQDGQLLFLFRREINPVQMSLQTGVFHEDSLLHKALPNVLTTAQWTRYQTAARERRLANHRENINRAVKTLENVVPLSDQKRSELVTLLAAEMKPARRTTSYGVYYVLSKLRQLPDDKLKRIYTIPERIRVAQFLSEVQMIEDRVRASGALLEDDEDKSSAPAASLKR